MIRVLIIEDEQSSAQRLKRMLEASAISCEVIGMAESNAAVKAFFSGEHPAIDLILSDIQLGDGLSFEALRSAPVDIPVIFTTAYDQYAVQAFKFNSLDYLLKPIDEAELQAALEKVRNTRSEVAATITDAIARLLDTLGKGSIRYRERFLIPHKADEYLHCAVRRCKSYCHQGRRSHASYSFGKGLFPGNDTGRGRSSAGSTALHAREPSVCR